MVNQTLFGRLSLGDHSPAPYLSPAGVLIEEIKQFVSFFFMLFLLSCEHIPGTCNLVAHQLATGFSFDQEGVALPF